MPSKNEVITIQKLTTRRDSYGGVVEAWADDGTA